MKFKNDTIVSCFNIKTMRREGILTKLSKKINSTLFVNKLYQFQGAGKNGFS
jgi:hypothetical protein